MTDKIKLGLKKRRILHSIIATQPNYLTLLRAEWSKIVLLVTTSVIETFFVFFADKVCSVVRLLRALWIFAIYVQYLWFYNVFNG